MRKTLYIALGLILFGLFVFPGVVQAACDPPECGVPFWSCDPGNTCLARCCVPDDPPFIPTPTNPPPATPTNVPPTCNFGGCRSNGCSSTQRYVSGDCNPPYSWYSGPGCYADGSCGSGPTPTDVPAPTPTPAPGTISGRVYCALTGVGISGVNVHAQDTLQNVMGTGFTSYNPNPALSGQYTIGNMTPLVGDIFAVRTGPDQGPSHGHVGAGTNYCLSQHETCSFIPGMNESGFDFRSPTNINNPNVSCNMTGGVLEGVFTWEELGPADWYILRVDHEDNPPGPCPPDCEWPSANDQWRPIPGATGSCSGGVCESRMNINDHNFQGGHYLWWSVQTRWQNENHCEIRSNPFDCNACEIDFPVGSIDVDVSSSTTTSVFEVAPAVGGNIQSVLFTVADTGVAAICDPSIPGECPDGSATFTDGSPAFNVRVTGKGLGNTTISAVATMDDGTSTCFTIPPANIAVDNTPAWWQAVGGGIFAGGGSISSSIPAASCDLSATCDSVLVRSDPSIGHPYPGTAIAYGGTIDPGTGTISDTDWQATNSQPAVTQANTFEYYTSRVSGLIKSSWEISPVGGDILTDHYFRTTSDGYQDTDGYRWFYYDDTAQLTIDAVQHLTSSKVVLVVDGDLIINQEIRVQDGGGLASGFFMAIVSGDIIIDPGVGRGFGDTLPSLEGIYFAEGNFETGSLGSGLDILKLTIRGSVAAGNIVMQRSLTDNSVTPGETFEFAPDQLMLFPDNLSLKRVRWREVAP